MSNMICYRCGYCGQPCNNQGHPLEQWQIAILDPFVDWDNPELVHGHCCHEEEQSFQRPTVVTREMAMDAGDPDMEGMIW